MGILTFSINCTLDGCIDRPEAIADEETHNCFTCLMDEAGAMLWGRASYEMMQSYWPAVARGEVEGPPAIREWAIELEAKPQYVASSTRKNFSWTNSYHISGALSMATEKLTDKLKDGTPEGVLRVATSSLPNSRVWA